MAKRRISDEAGLAALRDLESQQALAVRYLLQVLERGNEGGTIELRVPPFGAAQLIGGQTHRRGTPPNVVEADPESFIALALGHLSWDELAASGKLIASGAKAQELRNLFPINEVR